MSMDASTRRYAAPIAVAFGGPSLARLGRMVAISAIGLLAATGLIVCMRRAAGALSEPLSPGVLAALGLVLAVLAMLFRKAIAPPRLSRWLVVAWWATPSVVLVIWAAAVSLGGSETLGLVALFGALLVEEGWSWGRLSLRFDPAHRRRRATVEPPLSDATWDAPTPAGVCDVPAADADEAVKQWIVRRQDQAGDVIDGWVRVDFVVSQRHAAAHLAICPPMDRVPECFAEQSDGPDAQVKVAQVLSHGVRLEIKLDKAAAAPTSVVVEFSIQRRGEPA